MIDNLYKSKEDIQIQILESLVFLSEIDFDEAQVIIDKLDKLRFAEMFYIPDKELIKRLESYDKWIRSKNKIDENAGQLMEEIAYLAFRCLKGWNEIKSFQSYAAQFDLVISGYESSWQIVKRLFGIVGDEIIIEAKNYQTVIEDKHFSRMTHLLDNYYSTSSLGVFFTRKGASGFPKIGKRDRILRDCQATQIIYWARTRKYIIVFDHEDIMKLSEKGSLIRLIRSKISNVKGWMGEAPKFTDSWEEVALPSHLSKYNQVTNGSSRLYSDNIPDPSTIAERLRKLDDLKAQGLVSDDEYATRRTKILDEV